MRRSANARRGSGQHWVDLYVGKQIRRLREDRQLTQIELGETIGVSYQQVQKIENGTNRASISALHEIAKALGTPITEFLP